MKRVMISLLGALAFVSVAQASEPQATPATDTPGQVAPAADTALATQDAATAPAAQDETKRPDLNDRTCLRETGTNIRSRSTSSRDRKCIGANGRAYTRDDLQGTGEVDIADALRKLDPSIH